MNGDSQDELFFSVSKKRTSDTPGGRTFVVRVTVWDFDDVGVPCRTPNVVRDPLLHCAESSLDAAAVRDPRGRRALQREMVALLTDEVAGVFRENEFSNVIMSASREYLAHLDLRVEPSSARKMIFAGAVDLLRTFNA